MRTDPCSETMRTWSVPSASRTSRGSVICPLLEILVVFTTALTLLLCLVHSSSRDGAALRGPVRFCALLGAQAERRTNRELSIHRLAVVQVFGIEHRRTAGQCRRDDLAVVEPVAEFFHDAQGIEHDGRRYDDHFAVGGDAHHAALRL